MKKFILGIFLISSFFSLAFAQISDGKFEDDVPVSLSGIWEGKDRFVMFENPDKDNPDGGSAVDGEGLNNDGTAAFSYKAPDYLTIYLKAFYGWYLDRTAEPDTFDSSSRDRNNTTVKSPEYVYSFYRPVIASSGSNSVWELFVHYPRKKEPFVIPLAVINDSIYLKFFIKIPTEDIKLTGGAREPESKNISGDKNITGDGTQSDPLLGFWCGIGQTTGIKVSEPKTTENIDSIYVTENAVYHIRYWLCDMEYSDEKAFFSDGGKTYSVIKHIQSAGKVYTCVSGRSVTIRNVEKTLERPANLTVSNDGFTCGIGEPYLRRVAQKGTESEILSIVKKANSRRSPRQKPPFEPLNLDWHIKEIYEIEKNDTLIQAARKRQKEFADTYLKVNFQ